MEKGWLVIFFVIFKNIVVLVVLKCISVLITSSHTFLPPIAEKLAAFSSDHK